MNDYLERGWLDSVVENVFTRRQSQWPPEWVQAGHMYSDYKLVYDVPIFVGCFSEDGDLLSQWRVYAADATGYAIGFATATLST